MEVPHGSFMMNRPNVNFNVSKLDRRFTNRPNVNLLLQQPSSFHRPYFLTLQKQNFVKKGQNEMLKLQSFIFLLLLLVSVKCETDLA